MKQNKDKLIHKYFAVIALVLIVLLTVFDQFTKYLAYTKLRTGNSFTIIKNILEFNYVENKGAAGGILQGQIILLIVITIIIVPAICYFMFKIQKIKFLDSTSHSTVIKFTVLQYVLVLLGSGAIGNLIDRAIRNFVIDFIYFKPINFPVFNVADIYVTISAFALVIICVFILKDEEFDLLFPSKKKKEIPNNDNQRNNNK